MLHRSFKWSNMEQLCCQCVVVMLVCCHACIDIPKAVCGMLASAACACDW